MWIRSHELIMGYQEIKLEWPEVPKLKLKTLFLSHLVLISWASLGDWAGEAVLVHNIFFLFTFVWSIIHQDNEDSIFLCFAIDTLSVLLDIIILASRFPTRYNHNSQRNINEPLVSGQFFTPTSSVPLPEFLTSFSGLPHVGCFTGSGVTGSVREN